MHIPSFGVVCIYVLAVLGLRQFLLSVYCLIFKQLLINLSWWFRTLSNFWLLHSYFVSVNILYTNALICYFALFFMWCLPDISRTMIVCDVLFYVGHSGTLREVLSENVLVTYDVFKPFYIIFMRTPTLLCQYLLTHRFYRWYYFSSYVPIYDA